MWGFNRQRPQISALTLLSVHRLALKIFEDRESAGLAVLLTVASPVFFADGISYYSMPAHLLANTVFVLLLLDPTPRRAFAAGVIGSLALTLHNPVPHMLFAAPWIVSILRRPGGLPTAGFLFAGYFPLCVLLGLGWFFFSSNLTHEGVKLLSGESSTADTLVRMGSAFALPTSTILLARVIAIAKLWLWAVPGLLVLAAFGQSLLNFSSSQSFAPFVRDANETVSIRLHDLQITSSHQCTIDARASFEVGCRTKLCPCTSLQQQNFLLSHHDFLPIISSSLASFRDEGPFNSSQLTGEEKPSFSGGNEAALVRMQRPNRSVTMDRDLVGVLCRQWLNGLDHVCDQRCERKGFEL